MSLTKLLAIFAVLLFGTIGVIALFKNGKSAPKKETTLSTKPVEIELGCEMRVVTNAKPKHVAQESKPQPEAKAPTPTPQTAPAVSPVTAPPATVSTATLPSEANRIAELFNREGAKLPIVETITYKSRIGWQQGRPAWLSDYASHYHTSRHFIARSLNGTPDYFKQDVAEGDRFNVLRLDKNIKFYLLVDLSHCKMWFYYDDLDTKDRVLLKTYIVGLGRIDGSKASGTLTPLGKYSLGNKIAIYKPKVTGFHNGERTEMISVFGTRWIPFDKELENCSAPAKGFGIHGVPWVKNSAGDSVQDRSSLGKYQSDGCIRLASEDMEELFAIIITKPSVIEIVKESS